MSEEKIVFFNPDLKNESAEKYPEDVITPELAEAVKKFNEQFAERSFSQRHEELGKMVSCRLCNRRHRAADPLFLTSRAHGEQKEEAPSRSAMFKKQRINSHHKDKVRQFIQLAEKIYTEDIEPFFHDEPARLIKRAQRRAAAILKKRWVAALVLKKRMHDVSRRINRGLLPGGSR